MKRKETKAQRDARELAEAIAYLRDPGGDGKTRVYHGFNSAPLRCVHCGLVEPIAEAVGPKCECGSRS